MWEYSCSWSLQRQISVFKDMNKYLQRAHSVAVPAMCSVIEAAGLLCRVDHWETWSPLLKADTGSPDSSSMLLALSIHIGIAGLWMG